MNGKISYREQLKIIGSETANSIASYAWEEISIGDIEHWDSYLKAAIDNILRAPIPMYLIWGTDRLFFYNEAFAPILGNRPHSMGRPFTEVWSEVADELRPLIDSVYKGKTYSFADRLFQLHGVNGLQSRYFSFSYYPLATSEGNISGLYCIVTESTQALEAENALRSSDKEHRETLESIDTSYFSVDSEWIITSVNKLMEEKGQLPRSELIGKNFLKIFLSHEGAEKTDYWKYYHEVMGLREKREFVDYYKDLDLWTKVSAYPKASGGMSVFFRDINDEKKRELELLRAKEEAEAANSLKSSFLANMSHEIRTPLGAMMGFANLLTDPSVTPTDRANYVDILTRNGEQLGRVINDILDLSKVETGHIALEYMIVRPLQIAHEIVSLMSVVAKEKGLPLSLEDDGTVPETIVTDPTRMRQVLLNLVGNALKFTKVGFIKIKLSGYVGADGERCCAFDIEDTGTGVAPAAEERLFKVFSQADNSMTRRYGGTGLGLALSRALARKMGGDVELTRSERDRGSTFTFSVESLESKRVEVEESQRQSREQTPAEISENALDGVRVLLVEDSPDNQQLIWHYLAKFGAQLEIADNGAEGVQMALASEHDIVLMDIQMPVMDGYTAVAKLRDKGFKKPIVALTAHAMADVKQKCEDVGFTTHFPKPIDAIQLVRTIESLLMDY